MEKIHDIYSWYTFIHDTDEEKYVVGWQKLVRDNKKKKKINTAIYFMLSHGTNS